MQMTSLGLPDFRSGVATSLKESRDFLSRRLVGGGGPFDDTIRKKMNVLSPTFLGKYRGKCESVK